MPKDNDLCPSSDNGNHRYFIFKVVEVFEPVPKVFIAHPEVLDDDGKIALHEVTNYYHKKEYAISGCNCGSSIKQEIKQQ